MQIFRNPRKPIVAMHHVVHEIDIAEIVRSPGIVPALPRLGIYGQHQFLPVLALHRHNHFVYVQKRDVLVVIEVAVKTVVIRNDFVLAFVVHLEEGRVLKLVEVKKGVRLEVTFFPR